jgi:hypothetical protein
MPSEQEGDGGEKDGGEFFHSFALSIKKAPQKFGAQNQDSVKFET